MTLVTPDNQGPLVNVGMWITLCPMILCAGVKIYTKWETVRRFQLDDLWMLISMLIAVAQSVATSEQVHYGLGRNQNTLTDDQVDSFFLSEYVAQLLYIVTIFAAKLIGLHFYIFLAGPHSRKEFIKFLIYFCVLWTGIAIFVLSFQCHPPDPWLGRSGGCINKSAFWVFNGIVDIATQLVVATLPIVLLTSLQAERSKKLFSMLAFTPNLLVIPLSVAHLVYFFNTRGSENYTWDSFNLSLVTSLHAILSVLIAAVPFTKPMVDSMVLIPMAIPDEMLTYGKHKSFVDTSKGSPNSQQRSTPRSVLDSFSQWPRARHGEAGVGNFVDVTTTTPDEQELQDYEARDGSQERIIREQKGMIIHQTQSMTVTSTMHSAETV